jgi:YVTN family beta-propeller protein
MKKLLIFLVFSFIIISCTKVPEDNNDNFSSCSGVFILNEGNFNSGNGSLSYYSYDSLKIFNDMFYNINRRSLGDVPNSMTFSGDKAFIVVNNSGKIEVINTNSLVSLSTISGLISPRNMAFTEDNTKAYITSLYSDRVTIINASGSITGYIDLHRSSESIVITGNKAFISNWMGGDEIMVINTQNDKVIDSIKVGVEPESMVLDKNKKLWVLCNGGWQRNNFAELVRINTQTSLIEKEYTFLTKTESPTCLQVDGEGNTLYYLEKGVRKMETDAEALPTTTFIPESGHFFYKLGINPVNGDIFITDAVDYQNNGYVILYKKDGSLISTLNADISPASIYFKLTGNK